VRGRKVQMRLARHRKAPPVGATVPISYRRPCEALGRTRSETVRLCWVRVTQVAEQNTSEATAQDAYDEGYRSLEELRDEHSGPVWVIRFEAIVTETPRLLAREVIAGRQGGYTEEPGSAMHGEPEAVDEISQDILTDRANERDVRRARKRVATVGLLGIDDQVRVLTELARVRHVDVRSELRAIRRWVGNPSAQRTQLENLRAKLGMG